MTTKIVVDDYHNDRLARMIRMQRELQEKTFGVDFTSMSTQDRVNCVKENVLALTDELHELLAETSWKPWAKSEFLTEDKAFGELVDAWHFMMNIMVAIVPDLDPEDIADHLTESYFKKREVNVQRQEEGYDGVSTKCPNCKRALDDINAIVSAGDDTMVCMTCHTDVTDRFNQLMKANG